MKAKASYGVFVIGYPTLHNEFSSVARRNIYVRGLKAAGFKNLAFSKSYEYK